MAGTESLVSLFSGALGLDLGLEQAGFEPRFLVECDKVALKTIRLNAKRVHDPHVIEKRLTTRNVRSVCKGILKQLGLKPGDLKLLAGAPPCQPFSTAGKRHSVRDDRGNGFDIFFKAVDELLPEFFVVENVKGVLSAAKAHRPLAKRGAGFPRLDKKEQYGSAFRHILRGLQKLCSERDYCVTWGVLNSADFGTPQCRERLIIIGSRNGHCVWPDATYSRNGKDGKLKWVSVRTAFRSLSQQEEHLNFNKRIQRYLEKIPAGGNWRSLPRHSQAHAIGSAYKSWGGRSGFLRRLAWNKPAPTITNSPLAKATMLAHPNKLRPLTVRECARLQQFPDDWQFAGTFSAKYRQIGNATPVGLGLAVGRAIRTVATLGATGEHYAKLYCADPALLLRLAERPKTALNPPRMRTNKDAQAAQQWLASVGRSRCEFEGLLAFDAPGAALVCGNGKVS